MTFSDFLSPILFFISLGVFWAVISVMAYITSLFFKSRKPLGVIIGISVVVNLLYQAMLFLWYIFVAFGLFSSGQIVFGLVWVFILGGLLLGFYSFMANLVTAIPMFFSDKLEEKLEVANETVNSRIKVEAKVTKTKAHTASDSNDELEDWDSIK